MIFSDKIKEALLNASSKALATSFDNAINVVPVSSLRIEGNEIWLIDYFFNKTKDNLINNDNIALTCWSDFSGYQFKGKAAYLTEGNDFKLAVEWISKLHPNRKVKGLIVLTVNEIFDISIDKKVL